MLGIRHVATTTLSEVRELKVVVSNEYNSSDSAEVVPAATTSSWRDSEHHGLYPGCMVALTKTWEGSISQLGRRYLEYLTSVRDARRARCWTSFIDEPEVKERGYIIRFDVFKLNWKTGARLLEEVRETNRRLPEVYTDLEEDIKRLVPGISAVLEYAKILGGCKADHRLWSLTDALWTFQCGIQWHFTGSKCSPL